MIAYKLPSLRRERFARACGYGGPQEEQATKATTLDSWRGYHTGTCVYFIGPASGRGPVKIGFATNLMARFSQIQGGSPVPLAIYAAVPGLREDERDLHECHAASRMHGEWFRLTGQLEWMIHELQTNAVPWVRSTCPVRSLIVASGRLKHGR